MTEHDDLDLFRSMMADITPLEQDQVQQQKKHQTTDAHRERQKAAQSLAESNTDYLSLDYANMVKPDDFLAFKRDGVQEGVFRKMRLGKYEIQARLDLHRKTLKQAREDVLQFLKECQRVDIRQVLIVHGKGEKSNPPAMMKSYLSTWLEQLSDVMCYHSAQRFHGGTGALYVSIKKSAEKKLENRERHQKRLG
ncbi:DNA endonuclease SmrA [Thaumasiovibrio subtropicus]|uniref:DNA endonuclease SmrA n=1 Tax=Thaumasiovibrio subtropicus TaxID=1891207 RepID=UPI000B362CE4|nr:DNA endonuclease SmrA [Thaumasiovibrio subtropicus]